MRDTSFSRCDISDMDFVCMEGGEGKKKEKTRKHPACKGSFKVDPPVRTNKL